MKILQRLTIVLKLSPRKLPKVTKLCSTWCTAHFTLTHLQVISLNTLTFAPFLRSHTFSHGNSCFHLTGNVLYFQFCSLSMFVYLQKSYTDYNVVLNFDQLYSSLSNFLFYIEDCGFRSINDNQYKSKLTEVSGKYL